MRYLCLTFLVLLTTNIAPAQSSKASSEGSALEVVKFHWSKERIDWENDPFRGPIENFDEMRARTRNEKRITDAKRGGSGDADRVKREAGADAANIATQHQTKRSRYVFRYKATVRNLSEKLIKSIDWDYLFLDKTTDSALGRLQFSSEERIGPGKSKELLVSITRPPTQTISVTALNKNEFESLIGRIIIVRIEYADGSTWQAPETASSNP